MTPVVFAESNPLHFWLAVMVLVVLAVLVVGVAIGMLVSHLVRKKQSDTPVPPAPAKPPAPPE